MSMSYAACFNNVITEENLDKIVGEKLIKKYKEQLKIFDNLLRVNDYKLDKIKFNKIKVTSVNEVNFNDQDKEMYELNRTVTKICEKFKEKTGMSLELNYHDSENQGGGYDEGDGLFFILADDELYKPTDNYKKLMENYGEDVIELRNFVKLG